MTLVVDRRGRRLVLRGRPERLDGVYRLGFELGAVERTYSPLAAFGYGAQKTGELTVLTGKALAQIFTGSGRKEVSSVVGITRESSRAVEAGSKVYLTLLGFISLSLALLNLLPLLPLDGGHIAFSLAERVRGRAIPREAYERASALGIALVVMLFFIGLSNDIDRIRGG